MKRRGMYWSEQGPSGGESAARYCQWNLESGFAHRLAQPSGDPNSQTSNQKGQQVELHTSSNWVGVIFYQVLVDTHTQSTARGAPYESV